MCGHTHITRTHAGVYIYDSMGHVWARDGCANHYTQSGMPVGAIHTWRTTATYTVRIHVAILAGIIISAQATRTTNLAGLYTFAHAYVQHALAYVYAQRQHMQAACIYGRPFWDTHATQHRQCNARNGGRTPHTGIHTRHPHMHTCMCIGRARRIRGTHDDGHAGAQPCRQDRTPTYMHGNHCSNACIHTHTVTPRGRQAA